MRYQFSVLIITVIVISAASFVGRVVRVISVNSTNEDEHKSNNERHEYSLKFIENSSDHLIWFLQISDLHISVFYDEGRLNDFKIFTNETVAVIKPSAVLASGDLTDAKRIDKLGSRQYLEEWISYQEVLKQTNVLEKTVWLDMRGNHDNFDVASLASSNNYYQQYSIQGSKNRRSYMKSIKYGSESVAFIALDACLLPGPRRPFNFIGMLTSKDFDLLRSLEAESQKHNHTIWFGHFPTSCILSPKPGVRSLMSKSIAYMCGHLHTLGGFMHKLYTRQHAGYLELELADFKDERMFRVAAIDHGLFSFVDIRLGQWPVVLVTNPKESNFEVPNNEPYYLVYKSTHVRVLVWSLSEIVTVKMRIDSKQWVEMASIKDPLYVAPWNPAEFSHGTHILEVSATDKNGRQNVVVREFNFQGPGNHFGFWPRVLLMSDLSAFFQFMFGFGVFMYVVPLCVIRVIHYRVITNKNRRPKIYFCKSFFRKLWILCSNDKLFWPLILYTIYLPVGPWFIGEVLSGHVGVVFAWGTVVYGSFLPGSFTFAYGFLQLLVFHYPLLFLTAHSVDVKFQELFMKRNRSVLKSAFRHILFFLLVTMQVMNTYYFWLAYGTMATILGPLRTWAAILGIFMWYYSFNVKKCDLKTVVKIWCCRNNEFRGESATTLTKIEKDSDIQI